MTNNADKLAKKIDTELAEAVQDAFFNDGKEPGYEDLARILNEAYHQSASGKGRDRHANGKPFNVQPIMEIARMVGLGYQTGQIMKKAQEATTMYGRGNRDAAKAELLGVIVYAAAAILLIEEHGSIKEY